MKLLKKFFNKNIDILSFKEYVKLYLNKKDSIVLNKFLDGSIKKEYPKITFRKNGDVDINPDSPNPYFVDVNNLIIELIERKKLD